MLDTPAAVETRHTGAVRRVVTAAREHGQLTARLSFTRGIGAIAEQVFRAQHRQGCRRLVARARDDARTRHGDLREFLRLVGRRRFRLSQLDVLGRLCGRRGLRQAQRCATCA